jgi:hypothetical protein
MDPFACIVVLTVLPVLLDTLELCAGFFWGLTTQLQQCNRERLRLKSNSHPIRCPRLHGPSRDCPGGVRSPNAERGFTLATAGRRLATCQAQIAATPTG